MSDQPLRAALRATLEGLRAMILWTALTLGHYWIDGVIWKFKKYDLKPLVSRSIEAVSA